MIPHDAYPPGVSVCVPSHDGRGPLTAELLGTFEAARRETSVPVEMIIVDDAAEPECIELADRCAQAGATYLRGPREAGAKRNLAARSAKYDTLLFVDSDTLLTPSSIQAHIEALRAAPEDVAGIAGRVVMHGRQTPIWKVLEYSRLHNVCFDFTDLYREVGWGCTCNLSVRHTAFEESGGFSERTFTPCGGEDVDLGTRLSEQGYRWVTDASAIVLHRREPLSRWHEIVRKLFTYGCADVFLTNAFPRRRVFSPNPFAIALIAAVVTLPLIPLVPVAPAVAVLPPLVALAMDVMRPLDAPTVYGKAPARFVPRRQSGLRARALRVQGALIDSAFDVGVLWESLRRGRPGLAFCHFGYTDGDRFIPLGEPGRQGEADTGEVFTCAS